MIELMFCRSFIAEMKFYVNKLRQCKLYYSLKTRICIILTLLNHIFLKAFDLVYVSLVKAAVTQFFYRPEIFTTVL